MKNTPVVGIVIVTINSELDIKECLESIESQTFKNFKIILVDNASKDNTVELANQTIKNLKVIKNKTNILLTPANNLGIKYAIKKYNVDYILILNPDTKLSTNFIEVLLDSLEQDDSAFAAGPKVLFYKSKLAGLINSAGIIYDGFMKAYDRGFEEEDKGQYDEKEYVFGVTGAGILYKASKLKALGFYWERVKLYMDELELFIRAQKRGFKVIYNPKAILHHKWMQSSDKFKIERIQKLRNDAWLWIALRHYPIKSKIAMLFHYLRGIKEL